MRACLALLGAVGMAGASPTVSPSECVCPAHSDVADVYLGSTDPATPIVGGIPKVFLPESFPWIPQDGVRLHPHPAALKTLHCGSYYGWECRRVENSTVIKVDCKSDVCDVYIFLYHEPPRSSNTNGRLPQSLTPPEWQQGSCAPSFCIVPPTAAPVRLSERKAKALQVQPTAVPTQSPSAPSPCCRMTAFRRQIDQGDDVNVTIDEINGVMDAYYLLVAVAPGERCNSNARSGSQEACEAKPDCANAWCRWVTDSAPVPESKNEHPLVRAAHALINLPSAVPTASPSEAGRCVDNWCPRAPPGQAPPVCDAPLTEPECPVQATESPTEVTLPPVPVATASPSPLTGSCEGRCQEPGGHKAAALEISGLCSCGIECADGGAFRRKAHSSLYAPCCDDYETHCSPDAD